MFLKLFIYLECTILLLTLLTLIGEKAGFFKWFVTRVLKTEKEVTGQLFNNFQSMQFSDKSEEKDAGENKQELRTASMKVIIGNQEMDTAAEVGMEVKLKIDTDAVLDEKIFEKVLYTKA